NFCDALLQFFLLEIGALKFCPDLLPVSIVQLIDDNEIHHGKQYQEYGQMNNFKEWYQCKTEDKQSGNKPSALVYKALYLRLHTEAYIVCQWNEKKFE